MKPLRGTFSLVIFRTTSMKNGSHVSSRALGSCLAFGSLLIVTPAVLKGNSSSAVIVWIKADVAADLATLSL